MRSLVMAFVLFQGGTYALGGESSDIQGGESAEAETSNSQRPLDLPSGGRGTSEEEDSAESIPFYGALYEGDAFFFLLDISGSMWGNKLTQLKDELATSLDSLSSSSEFGIVAFSEWVRIYSPNPERATRERKHRARAWVFDLQAFGATHMLEGAFSLLTIAHKSRRGRRVVIAVGDGLPTNPGPGVTLAEIMGANVQRLPWNTILIGGGNGASDFMRDLAGATGGSFRTVSAE